MSILPHSAAFLYFIYFYNVGTKYIKPPWIDQILILYLIRIVYALYISLFIKRDKKEIKLPYLWI